MAAILGQPLSHLAIVLAADYPETDHPGSLTTNRLLLELRGETLLERDLRLFGPHLVVSTNCPAISQLATTLEAPTLPGKCHAIRSALPRFPEAMRFHILMGDVWYTESASAIIQALCLPIVFFGDGVGTFALSFDADQTPLITQACTTAIRKGGTNPRMAGLQMLRTVLNHDAAYEFICDETMDFDLQSDIELFLSGHTKNAMKTPAG